MNLIKKRELKTNNRIWLADKELADTIFKPGTHITYRIEKNKVTILPSKEGMTVAKRKSQLGIQSLIDIRNKEALSAFSGCDNLQVEIYEDQIIVHGLKKIMTLAGAKRRVVAAAALDRTELRNAAGGEQLSFLTEGYIDLVAESISRATGSEGLGSRVKLDLPDLFSVVSLFSGAGFLDYAFKDDFNIKWAIEWEPSMVKVYQKNIGNHIVCQDITKVNKRDIPPAAVVIGGTPCQGFSNANRKSRIIDDERNKLVRQYIEVVKNMKSCLVFILENVPQLITYGKQFLEELKEELSDFEITIQKLNAADFGSAQKRERAIIIGSKIGPIHMAPPAIRMVKTVRQALSGLTDKVPNQLDFSVSSPDNIEKMKLVLPGCNLQGLPDHMKTKSVHSDYMKRLSWDTQSITIPNPRKAMILHPEENRIISIRECLCLQDMPWTFVMPSRTTDDPDTVGLSAMQQGVGNGVPLALGKAIAAVVKEKLLEYQASNLRLATF